MKRFTLVQLMMVVLGAACSNQHRNPGAAWPLPRSSRSPAASSDAGLSIPASDVLFQLADNVPADDAGWDRVVANAVMLAESGNMMLAGPRLLPQPEWSKHAHDLVARSMVAAEAARKHDLDGVLDAGNAIYETCDACHSQFMPAKVAEQAAQPPAQ